jgi:hypothetical protein
MPNRKMEIGRGNRKHKHWRVTLTYNDNEIFGRVFIDRDRAESYAARQKKSPLVKNARIEQAD